LRRPRSRITAMPELLKQVLASVIVLNEFQQAMLAQWIRSPVFMATAKTSSNCASKWGAFADGRGPRPLG